MVQGLRLQAPKAGGLGSIPGQGTRSHVLHLKILHATMKMEDFSCCNQDLVQPSKYIIFFVKKSGRMILRGGWVSQ